MSAFKTQIPISERFWRINEKKIQMYSAFIW